MVDVQLSDAEKIFILHGVQVNIESTKNRLTALHDPSHHKILHVRDSEPNHTYIYTCK